MKEQARCQSALALAPPSGDAILRDLRVLALSFSGAGGGGEKNFPTDVGVRLQVPDHELVEAGLREDRHTELGRARLDDRIIEA